MSKRQEDKGRDSTEIFSELEGRPTPELDSERMWQRVAAGLTPRRAGWWQSVLRPSDPLVAGRTGVARLAYAAAGIAVLGLAMWAGFIFLGGGTALVPEEAGQMAGVQEPEVQAPAVTEPTVVRLAPPQPDAPSTVPGAGTDSTAVRLGIRLVRGFSGAVPADVQPSDPLATGGADLLADVRPEVTSLPFEQYGLVGQWEGELSAAALVEAQVSGNYTLNFATAESVVTESYVELTDVRLVGEIEILLASTLRLQPGRLYLLGVVEPGEQAPSVILAIRADVGSAASETDSSPHRD